MNEEQKKYVHEALKDDMERLHNEYGVDVSKWGFKNFLVFS